MPAQSPQTTSLEALVEPVCRAHGVELVQLVFGTHRGGSTLRVVIDRALPTDADTTRSGVSIDDCQAVSRDLSAVLDVHEDLISGRYTLEVSSPGVERPLLRTADYERFAGREAKIHVKQPIEERRWFRGPLLGVENGRVRIEQDGAPVVIPLDLISRANLVYKF